MRITDEDKMTKMIQLTSPVAGRVYLERPALTLEQGRAAAARARAEHYKQEGLRVDDALLVVDGVNIVKKHVKPNPMKGTTGGVVDKTMPIHQSNVAIYNAATSKADRVGIKMLDNGDKVRIYKSSGEQIKA